MLKRCPLQSVSHGSSYRSGISVLDAAEMEKTKEPCKTSSVQKALSSLFVFVFFCSQVSCFTAVGAFFFFFLVWMNPAAVKSRNNLLITFWSYVQYGAAAVFTIKQLVVWGAISATMQEEEELRGTDGTSWSHKKWMITSWSLILPLGHSVCV